MQKEVVLQLFSTCPHFFSILVSRVFRKKFKKVCVLQRRACNKFKRNYLENYNDSEHAVKTKNAPFFMIFPVTDWTGPLRILSLNIKILTPPLWYTQNGHCKTCH